jgi:4-hydroxy-tetrahydrodipicolinate synthase
MMRMIQSIRSNHPDFSFLTGWDPMIVPMLLAGATGGVNATSNVAPELTRRMYDLTVSGSLDEAMRLQYNVLQLFDRMFLGHNFPDGFRIGVDARGFDFGHGRQPSGRPTPDSREDTIKAEIARIAHTAKNREPGLTRHL